MHVRSIVFGFLILASAAPVGAGESLTMKVSPNVSFAPANLVVRTTVQADPANRAITIEADSGDFYRSSAMELDGDKAPRTTMFEFRSLPSGTYRVTATLYDGNGKTRAFARSEVNVISGVGGH
jgi:hypothetical protein